MTKEEKLGKVTKGFSLLSEEKQDYILGVIQSLAFAHDFPVKGESISLEQKAKHISLGSSLACAGEKK